MLSDTVILKYCHTKHMTHACLMTKITRSKNIADIGILLTTLRYRMRILALQRICDYAFINVYFAHIHLMFSHTIGVYILSVLILSTTS